MEFSRQEYWRGLPFPSSGVLPSLGIEPGSPVLQTGVLPSESTRASLVEIPSQLYGAAQRVRLRLSYPFCCGYFLIHLTYGSLTSHLVGLWISLRLNFSVCSCTFTTFGEGGKIRNLLHLHLGPLLLSSQILCARDLIFPFFFFNDLDLLFYFCYWT